MSPPPWHTGGSAHSSLCHLHPGTGQDPHQCPPARGLLVGCVPLGTQAGTQEGATRPPQHCAVPPSLRVAGEGHPQPGSQAGLGKGDTCVPTPGEPGVCTPPCPPLPPWRPAAPRRGREPWCRGPGGAGRQPDCTQAKAGRASSPTSKPPLGSEELH